MKDAKTQSPLRGRVTMSTLTRRDLMQIPVSEQVQLLEDLDRREKFESGSTRRRDQRYTFKVPRNTVVHVKLKEGSQRYSVLMRNISAKGCSVLHNSFLYPNTPCVVELRPLGGKSPTALGMIRRCTLVKDWIHEIGISFDEPIDITEIIPESDRPAEVLAEPPFWAEGRRIAARLRASIDARDIVASDKTIQELQIWQTNNRK